MRLSRQEIEAIVSELAESIAEQQQLELVEVEYVKEHANYILRVFIDKPGGVGLDDCQAMSRVLSDRLDEVDPIPGSYTLEVSSPGLTRPLKKLADYERFAGNKVHIRTYAPIEGRKNWRGTLLGHLDDEIHVEIDGVRATIPYEMIAQARLVPEWEDAWTAKGKGGKKKR